MGETVREEASKTTIEIPTNHGNKDEQGIRSLRSAVELTSEAVRAVSVTAFDALRASAKFMGVSKSGEELHVRYAKVVYVLCLWNVLTTT